MYSNHMICIYIFPYWAAEMWRNVPIVFIKCRVPKNPPDDVRRAALSADTWGFSPGEALFRRFPSNVQLVHTVTVFSICYGVELPAMLVSVWGYSPSGIHCDSSCCENKLFPSRKLFQCYNKSLDKCYDML